MADYQIGDNLYADAQGKYYRLNNGQKAYEESPFDTMSNKINTLYDAQRKNQLDLLKQQRDKAIAGFNQRKKDIAPVYQNQRNQADVVNAQNIQRLRELMAANGINASGESLTTQANLASSRQNALSEINNNEDYAIREIDKQIANENDPSREQSIYNTIEADRTKALADAWNQAQQQVYQQMLDWRNYQMQQQQAARSSTRSGGGGGSYSYSTGTKSKDQSYADWTGYFAQNAGAVNNMGFRQFEQQLRNNKSMINQIQNQGYNLDAVIDAMYAGASNGMYKSKADYDTSLSRKTKEWNSLGIRGMQ